MASKKKILIPGFPGDPKVEAMFLEAGFELDYALSSEERALGRVVPDRVALRRTASSESMQSKLATASAINGMGIGEPVLVDAAMIAKAPLLQVVFIGAAGYDRIDIEAANRAGVLVFNAPGGNADVVAEHTLGLMLSLAHHIGDSDRLAHATRKAGSRQSVQTSGWPLSTLKGRTLGLVGYGFVGRHVAERARLGLGMTVIAYDPFFDALEADRQGVQLFDNLDEVLTRSDVVSLHVPMSERTRNIIDARALGLMRKHALLINTARGSSIDTEALVQALRERRIAAAGLDVTEPEPLPDGHALFDLENVILTPHIAGAAPEAFGRSAVIAASLAILALRGQRPAYLVNPQAWDRYAEKFLQR